jgi:chromosome segregation protein
VDPTTVLLPTNLTGVVGPNGCGKSNIIDAVRWVMGESSAKHLRGESMADVIFNGSTSRKPVGQASIELQFDNSDGTLGGQYASYNDIAVKRQVSRDGQSVYFLNGTRCRRRDITDIFLGTGLGPRSYAIIEQGTISRLIEAKPEDMRNFLEEAAGISKYKERRRETETRMRHTRENLDRLNDLREELEKQLNHLQRQARSAERYKELKQEERHKKGELSALRWRELDEKVARQDNEISLRETALEEQLAHQRHAEAGIESHREAQVEAQESFNEVQSEFYRVGADIARLEQAIQHAHERFQQQQSDLNQIEQSWSETHSHLEGDREKFAMLQQQLEEIEPKYQEATLQNEVGIESLAEAESAMQQWQHNWDDFNSRANEPSQTAQVERSRIQQIEQQGVQLEQRIERIKQEMVNLKTANLADEIKSIEQQLSEQLAQQTVQSEVLEQMGSELQERRESSRAGDQQLDQLRTELQNSRGRFASLEALQQAALGKGQGKVNQWLEHHQLGDAQRLGQGIKSVAGWERAVETVLGDGLEAVCVESLDGVQAILNDLEQGSASFFESRRSAGSQGGDSKLLASKVVSQWDLSAILGKVQVAETLQEALAQRASLAADSSIITRDGIWVGPNWLRVQRGVDDHSGVLQRQQELDELKAKVDALNGQVAELTAAHEVAVEMLHNLEQEREQAQSQFNRLNHTISELKGSHRGKEARLEQITNRQERLQQDLNEIGVQREESESTIRASKTRLHAALEQMEQLAVEREILQQGREQYRQRLDDTRMQARQSQQQHHELQLKSNQIKIELDALKQAESRSDQLLNQLAERREALKSVLTEGDAPIQERRAELAVMLEQRTVVEQQLAEARRLLGDIDHAIREQEKLRGDAERANQQIRSELEGMRLRRQEHQVRRQTLQEKVSEAGFSIAELLQSLTEEVRVEECEQQLEQISQRISRLGPINLAAIDEYESQSERKSYLDAQNDDLVAALETLETAIKKIDKETRTRFKETFEKVNKGLQDKFPRLFGGGHAYLELTGDDLLDSGVSVMARPPGKRNSTIHLLSGGEKALTAVALVFAIFELNPAPFCMLDEVDAPLDEANVGRFCKLVKEMSERVQFIFITHNKATMELSTTLSGVTMHEPGVSRIVSVDVDEAAELAAL